MTNLSGSTILITGATDGIGLSLARRYHRKGARLVLVGRRPLSALDPSLFDNGTYCQADLSRNDCTQRIDDWLHEQGIHALDLVVHNAGQGYVGAIAEQPDADIGALTAVNLAAPIALTHCLLPQVVQAQGQLAYISSVTAVLPAPDYAVYAATKAALDGFVRNLRIELAAAKLPVRVALIHPGATATDMHVKSGMSVAARERTRFAPVHDVAAEIVAALEANRRQRTIGRTNKLIFGLGRAAPAALEGMLRRRAGRASSASPRQPGEQSQHCVITGAADGIGRALARQFAQQGYTITGIDVDVQRAMRAQAEIINAGGAARFVIADLADPHAIARVVDQLAERPPIDMLVHNAGISAVGPFHEQPLPAQMKVLDLNLLAPMLLTAGLLRAQRILPGALIVCMASLSHYMGYPGAAVYAASKDGLVSYARSLSVGLSAESIQVLTVFPGPTRTAHARRYSPNNDGEARRMDPERVAAQIVAACRGRRRTLIPGLGNRTLAALGRAFPRLAEQGMRRLILDKLTAVEPLTAADADE